MSLDNTLMLRGPGPEPGPWQPVIFDGGGTWQQYQTMQSLTSAPWAALPSGDNVNMEAWRRSPARSPEFSADVVVVAGQAALIGMAVGILSFPLPWMVSGFPWWSFGPVGLGSFAIATLALLRSNRRHLWNEEHVSQEAPEPPKAEITESIGLNIRHENSDGRYVGGLNLTLPDGVSLAMFYEFAKGVTMLGGKLAVDDWCGTGKPFSKKVYGKLLDVLLEADIVVWRDESKPKAGRRLPSSGRRALLAFCAEYEANK